MDNTILISLISAISAFLIALIPYFLQKRGEEKKLKNKIVDIDIELFKFNDLKESVEKVLFETKADRFLILMAHNGKEEMKFATAIYEQHKISEQSSFSFGATNKYIKLTFDHNYRELLKNCEKNDVVKMSTNTMEDSLLKNIYLSEKISHSNCYFIKRYPEYKSQDKDLLLYCTLATHVNEPFDNNDEVKFKTFTDYLKNELFV